VVIATAFQDMPYREETEETDGRASLFATGVLCSGLACRVVTGASM